MNINSNLETRKIPSLYFLYEVSKDGRIVRNVKSKRKLRQFLSDDGFWHIRVKIKGELIDKRVIDIVSDCWNLKETHIFVQIKSKDTVHTFPSIKDAATFIANEKGVSFNTVRSKMTKRRKNIYKYEIRYFRVAETIHDGSKEQEIVHKT